MVQARLPLSMLRLSNPLETVTMLTLAGHKSLIGALETWLSWRGCGDGKCMLMIGVSGNKAAASAALAERAGAGAPPRRRPHRPRDGREMEAEPLPQRLPAQRRLAARLRHRHGGDGGRLAAREPMMQAVEEAAGAALAQHGERVHTYTHLSHLYPQGASVYTTFVYRLAGDFEQDLARWRAQVRGAWPSSPTAAPSATSTAWAATTRPTWRRRRARWASARCGPCSATSTRRP